MSNVFNERNTTLLSELEVLYAKSKSLCSQARKGWGYGERDIDHDLSYSNHNYRTYGGLELIDRRIRGGHTIH